MFVKKLITAVLLLACFSMSSLAQVKDDYKKNWDKVEAFQKKGLSKSALQEVMAIQAMALKANNEAQVIKTYIHQVMFRNMVEEDSRENNIFYVDTLIEKAKGPAKNVLQSMQAEMFWQYLNNNRWKFYDRTKLANEKAKDITTWSIDKLYNTISSLYKASLSNPALLKGTPVGNYYAILTKGENTRQLRLYIAMKWYCSIYRCSMW